MLEGQLVKNQLLDRGKVKAALTGSNVALSPMARWQRKSSVSTSVQRCGCSVGNAWLRALAPRRFLVEHCR
jgi:hypothetical protein